MTGRVAAIDCGTNTIKLLIGALPDVDVREMRMVRLGQDLDRSGRIADDALARAFAAIEEYADLIRAHDVPMSRVRFVATSASRDAANADVFVAGVRARLGVEPEVVTGDAEAALSFDGAVRNLRTPPELPVLVVDVGGGSTELILGATEPESADSMDIGSVRLHERHLHSDPPTADEVTACLADIEAHLDACPVAAESAATVVGVAGTVTQLAAVALDLPAYSREAVDQVVLPTEQVLATVDRLLAMTVAERRALPSMHPGRADVIGAGVLILGQVLRRSGASSLVVSESDIPRRDRLVGFGGGFVGHGPDMKKLTLLAGVAIGYVLGSRAGRERYEQIKSGASKVAHSPKVQDAVGKAQEAAGQQAAAVVDAAKAKVQDQVSSGR